MTSLVPRERSDESDGEVLFELKKHLPPDFTNTWHIGLRKPSLQHDSWLGVAAFSPPGGFCSVQKLTLNAWGITADLKELCPVLKRLLFLNSLTLSDNKDLSGDLKECGVLLGLEALSLAYCSQITGNISALSPLPLRALFLEGCSVEGNVAVVEHWPNLMCLSLAGTQTSGSLDQSLPFVPSLRWLLLSGTHVAGSLSSLSSCRGLERLTLSDCANISGDISALARLVYITGVGLRNTGVKGDLASIATLHRLTGLELQGTMVAPVSEAAVERFELLTGCMHVDVPRRR